MDHLIGETTKIVEMEIPQKTFADADSTTIVTTSNQVNKELLLPPSDLLIKDSLKFDESEGEDVDVLGFEIQPTDDSEKSIDVESVVVVVEEKVQKEEQQPDEPKKDKTDTEEDW